MKKAISLLLLICFLSSTTFAFQKKDGKPYVDNAAQKKSKKEEKKRNKEFEKHRRYSATVNSRKAKALRKQQAKAAKGL
jgi:predicted N-acyltransferase